MIRLPSKETILKALSTTEWDFGNKVLYDLCKENFSHKEDGKIIAKVWLIGRAYAAAIERRRNKIDINDDFYVQVVAPLFRKSELDKYLGILKQEGKITIGNIENILKTHYYLMQDIKSITNLEKRSFCSKYLHFHLPELFFLYDSRAVNALRQFISRVPKEFTHFSKIERVDNEYAKFLVKCFVLKNQIENKYNLTLTNREFDKILILTANDNL